MPLAGILESRSCKRVKIRTLEPVEMRHQLSLHIRRTRHPSVDAQRFQQLLPPVGRHRSVQDIGRNPVLLRRGNWEGLRVAVGIVLNMGE